ncbi:hypothetical protein MMC26_007502 [Xylographa opegraphella]|nr:hypothetical protein [Xylographa opegraphella]
MSHSATALFTSQQQAADARKTSHPPNIHSQHFDVAAELTAANTSIFDARSVQLTPSILKSRDSAFSFPFLQASTAMYQRPFDINPAHPVSILPVQPCSSKADAAQPMQGRPEGFGLQSDALTFATGDSNTVPNPQNRLPLVPSTYGSYVAAFELRELSAFTLNLKERFEDIAGSAHDACQDLLVKLTKEFSDVMEQIRDLAKHEEDRDVCSLLRELTNYPGSPRPSGLAPPQTTNQRHRDQDLNWQASTLKCIHRRRDLMVQHINLLSKSRMIGASNPRPYQVGKLNYGPDASFLDCLQIEGGEWERLWDSFHVECERAGLTKERLSTLAKVWGVQFDTPETLGFDCQVED